jgi:phosphate transport system permease protein
MEAGTGTVTVTLPVVASPEVARSGWLSQHAAPAGGVVAASLALLVAGVSVSTNAADGLVLPVCVVLLTAELFLLVHVFRQRGRLDAPLVVLLGLTLVTVSVLGALPLYFAALGQSAIFHRSIFAVVLLCAVGLPLLSSAVFHFLGGTPSAEDASRYPVVLFPAVIMLVTYAGVLGALLVRGIPELGWDVITHAMGLATDTTKLQPGFANHLLGTGLLIVLTTAISLPIGAGTGVFLNEYAPRRVAAVVRFCTTALRGVSVLVLGMTAVSLIQLTQGSLIGALLVGTFKDTNGRPVTQGGSFLLAAGVISLLVVPVITRATEEGCRSVPAGLREGSIALGASDGYTLRRIILPWALPNIITSVLLGAAEAAGSLATLLFIASTGSGGIGPLQPVSSLSYAIFDAQYSTVKSFRDAILLHRMGGAVLLLGIALMLTAAALVVKHRHATRYRS